VRQRELKRLESIGGGAAVSDNSADEKGDIELLHEQIALLRKQNGLLYETIALLKDQVATLEAQITFATSSPVIN
jgi:hypothetical protein